VAPGLRLELGQEPTLRAKLLITSVNTQNDVFMWPLNLPSPDGRTNSWNESGLLIAKMARDRWVRVYANMELAAYDVSICEASRPDPVWPTKSMSDLLRLAFRDRYIMDLAHPVLRRLRGEL